MKAAFCQQDFHSVRINLKLFDLFSLDSVGLNTEPDNKNRNVVCDAQTIVFFLSHLFDGILTLYVVDLQLFLCWFLGHVSHEEEEQERCPAIVKEEHLG